jgi:hypothetical protein
LETAGVTPSKVKGSAVKNNRTDEKLLHDPTPLFGTEVRSLRLLIIVVILRPHTTIFDGISHLANCKDRKKGQPPLLFGLEGLVERLPRIRESVQVSRALHQTISPPFHELDRITIT